VLGLLGTKDKASEISGLILEEAIYEANIVGNFSLHGGVLSSLALPQLKNLGPCNLKTIIQVLNPTYKYASNSAEIRFMAHYLGGGDQEIEIIMQWLGKPRSQPKRLTHAQGVKVLKVFEKAWKPSESLPFLREDLEKQIAVVSNKVSWQPQDIALLQRSYNNFKAANSTQAGSVQSVIVLLKGWQWVFGARNTLIFHAAFWLVLIFAYPSSSQIQAIFFWNPWVRKILGVGYVGFLLAWVPFLRQKLFKPFLPSLLADAGLENFNPQAYFPESEVKVKGAEQTQAIALALPAIRGQIVLEGDSGLGKSMFLRHLVQRSQRIVVYLPAQKCDKGVIEAIQAKLHGQAQDAEFLKNLIYSGAIDICIDGLNEVTADTRAKITQFVECYFKGNVIMTTQPLEWTPPSTAKTYVLQPLQRDQIERYLISRQPLLNDAKLQGKDYEQACLRYLTTALSNQQPAEELAAAQRILSNPMDLTIVAKMLATGTQPNLLRLQEQLYQLMAEDYQQMWKQEFPLKQFSEAVYQMRLKDQKASPAEEFYKEVLCMEDEKFKMVVSRQWLNPKSEPMKEWYFRHDKIAEFFIVQTFLGEGAEVADRLKNHISDPRFRGVYFLLATLLPLDAAQELREDLIQYAADTKDHTVSDTFVQLLRSRQAVPQPVA
jgi:hypothetical protein